MLDWLLSTDGFVRRWDCGDWSPALAWATIAGNVEVGAAYYLIPLFGWWLHRRRPNLLPDRHLTAAFGAFIFLCGTTHLLDSLLFWWPGYRLNAVARQATAVVSLATVALLWAKRRKLEGYKSPAEYAEIVARLEAALAEKDAALASERAARREKHDLADRLNGQNLQLLAAVAELKAGRPAAVDPHQSAHDRLVARLERIARTGAEGVPRV